jgi:hypothetical protein
MGHVVTPEPSPESGHGPVPRDTWQRRTSPEKGGAWCAPSGRSCHVDGGPQCSYVVLGHNLCHLRSRAVNRVALHYSAALQPPVCTFCRS